MAKTKFLTTIPQKVAFGGLVVVTVLAVAWGIWMSLTRNPTTISDDSIREEITPVVKLVTYEYNFTQLLSIDEAGNPLGWENPLRLSDMSQRLTAKLTSGSMPIR